jgi:hypothetical protein
MVREIVMAKDPGKTLQTASRFQLSETLRTVRESLGAKDQIDVWKINPKVRSSFDLTLNGIAQKANIDVSLLDSVGRVIQSSNRRGNKAESLKNVSLEPGTFYVQLKLQPGSSTTRYALKMSADAVSDDSFETATSLRASTATFSDSVGNNDLNDFLKLTPLVAGQLNVGLTGLSDDANVSLFDNNRNLIFTSSNSGTLNESINQRLTDIAGSTYFLQISPALGKEANYTINYSFTADAPTKTASGLELIDLVPGTGATPQTGQIVTVEYTGIFLNGTKFDSNQSFSFRIGVGQVIKGWDEGIGTMQVGGRRQLILPAELAYGSAGTPDGTIPPNAPLIFDVKVLSIR